MDFELLDGLTVRLDGLNMNLLRLVCGGNEIWPRQCFFQYFFIKVYHIFPRIKLLFLTGCNTNLLTEKLLLHCHIEEN